jgi:hypothetical protein
MSEAVIVIPRPSVTADNEGHGVIITGNRKGRPTIWTCLYGEDYVEMLWKSSAITYGLFLPQVNAVIYRKIILWSILVQGIAQWCSLRKTVSYTSTWLYSKHKTQRMDTATWVFWQVLLAYCPCFGQLWLIVLHARWSTTALRTSCSCVALTYSRTPLIRTLVIRIGLALPVNIFLL